MRVRRSCLICVFAVAMASLAWAETDTVCLLHTNDFHDHIRPGYEGEGGLPYVSGYIQAVKGEREDVLVLDGGDVMEKGDLVAFRTKSTIMYEAISRIGYHAVTVGNHDFTYGLEHLQSCTKVGEGVRLLCLNCTEPDGSPAFPGSQVFDIDGVKVGVIGLTLPKDNQPGIMNIAKTGELLKAEAERLDKEAHLIVATCHMPSKMCGDMAAAAPQVDVFVSGHAHEVLREPLRAENGALIVQAGDYARYLGRLELEIDLETEEIVASHGELIEMVHEEVPCDTAMTAWLTEQEQKVCPEALRKIAFCEKGLGRNESGRLAAAALCARGKGDIGFCHPAKIVRDGLPVGDVDVNAVFRTGGQRGHKIVTATVTGAEIETYLKGLLAEGNGRTQWAGFKADFGFDKETKTWQVSTNLKPKKQYKVVLPEMEWETRLERELKRGYDSDAAFAEATKHHQAEVCDFSFTDAVVEYIERLAETSIAREDYDSVLNGVSLEANDEALEKAQSL